MPKLVKLNTDYCDEFDVKCFAVIKDDWFPNWESKLENHNKDIEFYFGSNEFLGWSNGQELLEELTISDISTEQSSVLESLFPAHPNGLGIVAVFGTGCNLFDMDEIFYE